MSKVMAFNRDGSIEGVIAELITMCHANTIESMIVIVETKKTPQPKMAFCNTVHPAIELGLLELAKLQCLKTRDLL